MKKKLLFSLLLGTAFIWTNNLCAAEVAPAAEEAKPAGDKAAVDTSKVGEDKKFKIPSVQDGKLGAEIEVSYHTKKPDIVYKSVTVLDGGVTQAAQDKERKMPGKHNYPYVAGQKLPEGYKIINIWVKIDPAGKTKGLVAGGNLSDNPEDIAIAIFDATKGDANWSGPAGYDIDNAHAWMLMNDKNEIFIAPAEMDPNAEDFLGKDHPLFSSALARVFSLPDEEATTKLQAALKKSAELEKAAGSGGGASSEEVEKLKAELAAAKAAQSSGSAAAQAIDPSAPLTKTFEFEGMKFLALASSAEAKKHPELFDELVMGLFKLFSTQPKVATAIIATMLKSDPAMEGGGQFVNVSVSNAYKMLGSDKEIDLVADVQFSTDVSYIKAEEFITELKVKYNNDDVFIPEPPVSAEKVAELQANHEAELQQREEELAKTKAEAEHAINVAAQLNEEKAALEAEAQEATLKAEAEKAELEAIAKQAELEKAQVEQQRDAAVEVAAKAYDKVAETTAVAEHNAQIAEHNAAAAQSSQMIAEQNAKVAEHNAQVAEHNAQVAQNTQEVLSQVTEQAAAELASKSEPAPTAAPSEAPTAELASKAEPAPTAAPSEAPAAQSASKAEPAPTAAPSEAPAAQSASKAEPAQAAAPSEAPAAQSAGNPEHVAAPAVVAPDKKQDSTSVGTDLDDIAKEQGVPNKQLTADILNKSAPHPLVSSLALASAAGAARAAE